MAPIEITDDLVTYLLRYGGRCRECADNFGLCPNRPLPCADADKTIRHVLEAYNYGVTNGFIPDSSSPPTVKEE